MVMDGIRAWWERRRDQHLAIWKTMTLGSVILLLWSLWFFMIQGNFQPSDDGSVDWPTLFSWIAVFAGIIGLFWAAPEFFFYQGHHTICRTALEIDTSAELRNVRSEALESAKILGPAMETRIKEKFAELGVDEKRSKKRRS